MKTEFGAGPGEPQPERAVKEFDLVAVGKGLLPQALNEWNVASSMVAFIPERTTHGARQDLVTALNSHKPVPYLNYIKQIIGSGDQERAIRISNSEAILEYDNLVEQYSAVVAGLTVENLEEKGAAMADILVNLFRLFGQSWPPASQNEM